MDKPETIYINRELSWLDFDNRVLALAKEKNVPLGERIKFAAIFGSNMDEFFYGTRRLAVRPDAFEEQQTRHRHPHDGVRADRGHHAARGGAAGQVR